MMENHHYHCENSIAKTGITDVGKKTARLKWDWAGHVTGMHQER